MSQYNAPNLLFQTYTCDSHKLKKKKGQNQLFPPVFVNRGVLITSGSHYYPLTGTKAIYIHVIDKQYYT